MPECLVPFHKAVMVHVVCRCGVEHACLSATSADTDRTQAIPAPPPHRVHVDRRGRRPSRRQRSLSPGGSGTQTASLCSY